MCHHRLGSCGKVDNPTVLRFCSDSIWSSLVRKINMYKHIKIPRFRFRGNNFFFFRAEIPSKNTAFRISASGISAFYFAEFLLFFSYFLIFFSAFPQKKFPFSASGIPLFSDGRFFILFRLYLIII